MLYVSGNLMTEFQFWDWFTNHSKQLEHFMTSNLSDYSVYNELSAKLKTYHNNVIPELTMDKANNFILILSADGISNGIIPIEKLFASAPLLNGWIIQKFRKPGAVSNLNFRGLGIPAKDVKIKYSLNANEVDIELYIKGYKENDSRYKSLGFLYLDHFIGEYSVMTKVGNIQFRKLGLFLKPPNLASLEEFAEILNALK